MVGGLIPAVVNEALALMVPHHLRFIHTEASADSHRKLSVTLRLHMVASHCVGDLFGSQGYGGMTDRNRMNVQWSLDRAERSGGDVGACQICGKQSVLIVDDTDEFCGVCAHRTRVSDLQRLRLFRLAIG